jgi:hypothetical protein
MFSQGFCLLSGIIGNWEPLYDWPSVLERGLGAV